MAYNLVIRYRAFHLQDIGANPDPFNHDDQTPFSYPVIFLMVYTLKWLLTDRSPQNS